MLGTALAFFLGAANTGVAAAGPLFVSPSGNDANDCQTFATACRTLGAAVSKASAGDTIIIATGVYTEGVTLNKNLTLIGFGSDASIINGGRMHDVLDISAGVRVNVYDLAVTNGYAGIYNYGILTFTNSTASYNDEGLVNEGRLTVNSSFIHDNRAFVGAGIYANNATSTVNNSIIVSNSVNELGAGIFSQYGNLTLNNTLIANNVACNSTCPFVMARPLSGKLPNNGYGSQGAGIFSDGTLTVTNSTITGNTVIYGTAGGVYSYGPATISNTTISGNIAGSGAGVLNISVMTLTNVTLSDNVNDNVENAGSLWMRNSVMNNGGCASNAVISLGHNLDSGNSCALSAAGDLTNTNPLLGPLQNNGGPTPTQALLPGSPAINHGDNNGCPATDQRGITRPQAGICDIGAYEYVFPYSMYLPLVMR